MAHIKDETEATEKQHINKGPIVGIRHLQAGLLFLNFAVLYIHRTHVGISLVAMTNADKSNPNFPEYNWNEEHKSYILSTFYWGYVLAQLPGAYYTRRYGVKINLSVYTLGTGVFSLVVPFCVSWGGWQAFCVLRFIQGVFQGGSYPALVQHLAKWSPPDERGLLNGIAHTGLECGSIAAMALSGVIATSSMGWPGIFYIFAGLCFAWYLLWQLFGANDASAARFIGKTERQYIAESLQDSVSFDEEPLPVPWRAIFTSKPFYGLLATRVAAEVGLITIQGEWPSYMNAVLKLKIENNGVYSSLPFVASGISAYIFMFIANLISRHNLLSLTATRKCFNSFGMWVPAICLLLIGHFDEELDIIIMIVVMALYNSIVMGSIVSFIEMAPNHTDVIVSLINVFANLAVLLGPIFFGIIIDDEENRGQWQTGFATIAAMFCIGDLAFLIWGTSDEQPWNATDYLTKKKKTLPYKAKIAVSEQTIVCDL